MGFPHAEGYAGQVKEYHILGHELCLTSLPKRSLLMSEKGQKRTWRDQIAMSALPPIADIDRRTDEVTLNETPKGVPFRPTETTRAVCDGDTVAGQQRASVRQFCFIF
jgi:hypothetical protein